MLHQFQHVLNRWQVTCLFLVSFSLLFMNFYDHRLSGLSASKFIENEYPSERFVIQRIVHDQHRDPAEYGGLMITYDDAETAHAFDRDSSKEFEDKKNEILEKIDARLEPTVYASHAAFQLTVLQPVWSGLSLLKTEILKHISPESRTAKRLQTNAEFYIYKVSQAFAAILSALVLTLFLLWTRREFSLAVAYITLAGILVLCPSLTYFARNLWWMMGLWFLPMVVVFWGYSLSKNQMPKILSLVVMGALAGLGVFMRVSCGYEYASTVMMSALVPVVYYSVKKDVSKIIFIRAIMIVGGLVFCGFLAAIYHHYLVLEHAGFDGIETIKSRFMMRSSDAGSVDPNADGYQLVAESVKASVWGVLAKYLYAPQGIALPEILYLIPVLLCWKKWQEPSSKPLFCAMIAAFIGAISMLVILKGHAYIHGFDIVVWSVPLNLLIILWGAVQLERCQFQKSV